MTETTEHIAESYIRHCLHWFTNTNIKARNNKEIDILAVDKKGNKYWIECGVSHDKAWKLKAEAQERDFQKIERKSGYKKAWRNRNSVDYFIEHKFENEYLKEKIKEFGFKDGNYNKIIVCWAIQNSKVKDYAKNKGVKVWELKEKIKELMKELGETYYGDDILRTLQLVGKLED